MTNDIAPTPITENDVASVLGKLHEWKKSLSVEERQVVDLVINPSGDIDPDIVVATAARDAISDKIPELLQHVVDRLGEAGKPPDTWMKIGPIWVKANKEGFQISPAIMVERTR